MLEEEERQRGGTKEISDNPPRRNVRLFDWPPKNQDNRNEGSNSASNKHRRSFFSTLYLYTPGLKRVAWPPPPEEQDHILVEELPVYSKGPAFADSVTSPLSNQPQRSWNTYNLPQTVQSPPVQQAPASQLHQLPQFEPPPTTVILRPVAPISQAPPPIYESQPAAMKATGPNMRGDEKWPPAEHKARSAAENEARLSLARGPAVRPRKQKKDYRSFFAQNALTPNYPAYRAPPGTQHYVEEGTSNF